MEDELAKVYGPAAVDRSVPKDAQYARGIVLLFVAAALWSLNGALIKLVNRHEVHGVTIAFWRSLFAGLFLMPLAWGRWHTLRAPLRARDGKAARAAPHWGILVSVVVFALMTTSFVVASTKTEAANAIILQYTSTFWIFGLSPLVTGEHPSLKDIPFLLAAMAGIGIIFVDNAATDLLGLVIALGAGFFYGLLVLMLRRVRDCDPGVITVMNNLGTALLLLVPAMMVGKWLPPIPALALLIGMGAIQLGLPYYLFSKGLAHVPAHEAALITMVEPILVPVWAYLAVGETVSKSTIAGGAVILAALVAFLLFKRRAENGRTTFDQGRGKGTPS